MKHTTKLFAVLVGMLLISFAVAVPVLADAEPSLKFSVALSSSPCVAPCTVTVKDETINPDGYALTYEWRKNFASGEGQEVTPYFGAGSPECLNAECSQARWTYSAPGIYGMNEKVSWTGGSQEGDRRIDVLDPADAPAPIILTTPTTVSLPTVLDVASPKPHLELNKLGGGCFQPALKGSEAELCEPYFIKRVGPDGSGLYHYRFRLVVAYPGPIEVIFRAWNASSAYADQQTFALTVTGNASLFGDVRSCYWPVYRNPAGNEFRNVYDLYYYAVMNSRVVVRLQERRGHRWVTTQRRRATFSLGGTLPKPPWTRRVLRLKRLGPPKPGRRLIYEIRHGKTLLKRGHLSKQHCTVPG